MSCTPDNRFSETAPILLQRMSPFGAAYGPSRHCMRWTWLPRWRGRYGSPDMKPSEAHEKRISIRLSCNICGANQPAYVQGMIEGHGPDTELDVAIRRAPCIFCGVVGDFTTFIMKIE